MGVVQTDGVVLQYGTTSHSAENQTQPSIKILKFKISHLCWAYLSQHVVNQYYFLSLGTLTITPALPSLSSAPP